MSIRRLDAYLYFQLREVRQLVSFYLVEVQVDVAYLDLGQQLHSLEQEATAFALLLLLRTGDLVLLNEELPIDFVLTVDGEVEDLMAVGRRDHAGVKLAGREHTGN